MIPADLRKSAIRNWNLWGYSATIGMGIDKDAEVVKG